MPISMDLKCFQNEEVGSVLMALLTMSIVCTSVLHNPSSVSLS